MGNLEKCAWELKIPRPSQPLVHTNSEGETSPLEGLPILCSQFAVDSLNREFGNTLVDVDQHIRESHTILNSLCQAFLPAAKDSHVIHSHTDISKVNAIPLKQVLRRRRPTAYALTSKQPDLRSSKLCCLFLPLPSYCSSPLPEHYLISTGTDGLGVMCDPIFAVVFVDDSSRPP
jgi:hypothetical protein